MPTIGDTTDPQGTRRPKEDPLVDEYDTFKPLNIPDRASQVNLPSDILPIDAYGIFSLFFSDAILNVIAQNTNRFARIREDNLKKKSPDRHPKEP